MSSSLALLSFTLATLVLGAQANVEFVTIRTASRNRTLLCWAIKLSPTAYVADAPCVRSYRKHQIVMIYGDATPDPVVRERLGRKVASLRHPSCSHRVSPLVLVGSDGDDRSALGQTVRNFIASYGTLEAGRRTMTCRVCQVAAIRRVLPCPNAPPGTVVLYSDCRKQLDTAHKVANGKSRKLEAWAWKLRRKLRRTLYEDLERQSRQRLEVLNFIGSAKR